MSNLQKTSSIVLYILFIITVGIAGWFYFGGDVGNSAQTAYPEPKATGLFLTWGFILFLIATAITLLFSLIHIFSNPQSIKNAVIVLVLGGVLLLISYLSASEKSIPHLTVDTTAQTLKWVGTGLYATYILGAVAFLGIIFSEIYRATR